MTSAALAADGLALARLMHDLFLGNDMSSTSPNTWDTARSLGWLEDDRDSNRMTDLGWLVAWLGPACLMMGLRGLSPWRALRHTFVAVWLTHSLILHWFYVVTVTYGHAPAAVGVAAPIGASGRPVAAARR